jgi:hypothetical protein
MICCRLELRTTLASQARELNVSLSCYPLILVSKLSRIYSLSCSIYVHIFWMSRLSVGRNDAMYANFLHCS